MDDRVVKMTTPPTYEPATSLQVIVHDEHGIIFEGPAAALSSVNEQGPFDILPEHTNFITLIKKSLSISLESGEVKQFDVAGGVLHCYTSKIEIYLGVQDKRKAA